MKFTTVDEVEVIFGRTLTFRQREMIQHYIDTEERPATGSCMWCDEADMRILTAEMDLYNGPTPYPEYIDDNREIVANTILSDKIPASWVTGELIRANWIGDSTIPAELIIDGSILVDRIPATPGVKLDRSSS